MKCSKCGGDMLKSYVEGNFSAEREDKVCDGTVTNKYMCKKCGYIEEYAENPNFYKTGKK